MISIEEAIDNELISSEILNLIPRVCKYCNSEIVFVNNLKNIYCSNNSCISKKISRFKQVAGEFGISVGSDEAEGMIDDGTGTLVSVYRYLKDMDIDLTMSLWEYIKSSCIPGIPNTAYKLFYNYDDIEEAYKDIYNEGITIINTRLGLDGDSNIIGANIYKLLMEHKGELEEAIEYIDIIPDDREVIKVVIDSYIQGYSSINKFISYLNKKYKSRYLLMGAVTKDTDILFVDGETGSLKYKTAIKINGVYGDEVVKIMSSERYVYELDKSIKEREG